MWNWIVIAGTQTIAAFIAYGLGRRRGHKESISGHMLPRSFRVFGISETCINCGCQETDREE